ncbi:MAG: dephospho-CoA kinase [Bacteroidales bacterium]|jgi:dephospho-CoA kinase|nr:dephospho-CoA kinase [Bacteroidales bacterium]
MLRVGITGGIGSGKTTVCKVFELLGVPVYYADERAKRLMDDDPDLKEKLNEYFGSRIYCPDGRLNRRLLAEIIFASPAALRKVNGWVHPAVERDFLQWCSRQETSCVMEESAILFESRAAQRFDKIILVAAPCRLRIRRVCSRDGAGEEAVRQRIHRQWSDRRKIPLADFVIRNDHRQPLLPQIIEIHRRLSVLSP